MANIRERDISTVASHGESIEKLKLEQKRLFDFMTLTIIVLLVGFFGVAVALGGLVVDTFRSKEASYTDLVKSIDQTNLKVDLLTQKLH